MSRVVVVAAMLGTALAGVASIAPAVAAAQPASGVTPEQRQAMLQKQQLATNADRQRMMALVGVSEPTLPPPADDPRRPANTSPRPNTPNWYDASGNFFVRSSWGAWTNNDEAKSGSYTLPDPLRLKNGQRVTTPAQWYTQRRPEILADFANEIYGRIPERLPRVSFAVASVDSTAFAGQAVIKRVTGSIDNREYPSASPRIDITMYLPPRARGRVPLVVVVGGFFSPPNTLPSPVVQVLARGWAMATVNTGNIQADNGAGFSEGIIGLSLNGAARQPTDWGVLAAWSWGMSRALDYFETDSAVDVKRTAIEGHSRWGKTALLAGALDTRWSIVWPSCSGAMGASLEMRDWGETIDNVLGAAEYHWMAGNFFKYAGKWNSMPVDAHELIALVAPRPIFVTGGTNDQWSDPKGEFLAAKAAEPVYQLLGKHGLGATQMPAPDVALTSGELAFRNHEGGHTDAMDWPVFLNFAARYFTPGSNNLRVARIFSDGMVLQRGQPVRVWGTANAGSVVSVSVGATRARATTAKSGSWTATLPALRAGGPLTLTITSGSDTIQRNNVLVGDVWVASGQSNMEFAVFGERNAQREIAAASDSGIRQFKIPNAWAESPQDTLVGGAWTVADKAHVGAFTAVGYFFARELRASTKVPIGIINSTWGGSNIESWMSRRAYGSSDSALKRVRDDQNAQRDRTIAALRARIGTLPTVDGGMQGGRAVWADSALDEREWTSIPVPSYWEGNGYDGLDGVGWYRTWFDLTAADVQNGVTLNMAAIDDDDVTWVNGSEVGRTVGYNVPRNYKLPPSTLRVGRNQLTVRVTDGGDGGGINAPVRLRIGDSAPRSLAGNWKFKVGVASVSLGGQQINKIPMVLHNQMMNPITPFAVKGFIWYQGESNANNDEQARAYRAQFQKLITAWRADFGGPTPLPFLWVQLPNYGAVDATPPRTAGWALQRESMEAALAMPSTGQAITIDIGEAEDIHPRNKIDVGQRLARVAQRTVYGLPVQDHGPTYLRHAAKGDTIVVTFSHAGKALVNRNPDGKLAGFAIAGDDQRFVWANARVDGTRVLVWSDQVKHPVAVRYAWANNPGPLSLYNADKLPAAPFRTDKW